MGVAGNKERNMRKMTGPTCGGRYAGEHRQRQGQPGEFREAPEPCGKGGEGKGESTEREPGAAARRPKRVVKRIR